MREYYNGGVQELINGALHLGLSLTAQQVERFQLYYDELVTWNRRMNLTAIVDYEEVQVKHFLDSLTLTMVLSDAPAKVADIGTGAGLPGIALKIACPNIELTLIDSTQKKALFLNHIVAALGLEGVSVVTGRAEELAHDAQYREHFDAVLARGVAKMASLAELTLPFCAVGGTFIAMKTWPPDAEVDEAERALNVMGGRLRQIVRIGLGGLEDRSLVVIDKVRPTPEKYPRRSGIPQKRPLLCSAKGAA
jgi:16S rRNA (guanine527-N7)-methyltransferase